MTQMVQKRKTFYLAGYDPRGSRHYYNMYKKEALEQSKINGMEIEVASRRCSGDYIHTWKIHTHTQQEERVLSTETEYSFLSWDDLIRQTWRKSFFAFVIDAFRFLYIYCLSGIIVRWAKLFPPFLKAALSPFLYILLTLLAVCAIFYVGVQILTPYLPTAIATLLLVFPAYLLIKLSMHFGSKIAVLWLLRLLTSFGTYVSRPNVALSERLELFAVHIADKINSAEEDEIDEILIVAHSVGTILAIPMLASILERIRRESSILERVSVMTLGECIPLVSFLKDADAYRSKMRDVSESGLFWVDFSSPIDQVCFPLLDFYAASGMIVPDRHKPLLLSPRFHTMYHKEKYVKTKKDIMAAHFLYLMSTDRVGEYDYFKITAGHLPLCHYAQKGVA